LINYGSKNSFYKLADEAGFWEFISAPNEMRARKKKDLLEDTFEAYLGAVTVILNREALEARVGPITRPGYSACYNILSTLFDEMKISLAHEDLYDAKTRLKETFDMFGEKLGKNPAYKEQERGDDGLVYSTVYSVIGGKWNKIGDGVATKKADAQQAAATSAIETLGKRGIRKMAPALYRQFSTGELKQEEITEADVKRLITRPGFEEAPPGIDTLYQTRGKSKHQARYASTYLGKYCFEHNYGGIKACLSLGACPNVRDTYGLTAFDLLLTTSPGPRMVRHVLKKFLKKGSVMVSPVVLARYGELGEDDKYTFVISKETVVISVAE
jgi:dsRNA-specific ribonuclease